VARQLALAHSLQGRIDSGEFRNQAELARSLGFSRERIAKILDLLLLAPDIQEEILFLQYQTGQQAIIPADLGRDVLGSLVWEEQRVGWEAVARSARPIPTLA
jgi:ParB-like chromosome segregation protein Spo0J